MCASDSIYRCTYNISLHVFTVLFMISHVISYPRKHGEEFEHFTPQQSSLVRETIRKTIDYLKQHNNGDTLKLEEYLE